MGAFAGLGVISREMYHRRRPGTRKTTSKPLEAGVFRPAMIHHYPVVHGRKRSVCFGEPDSRDRTYGRPHSRGDRPDQDLDRAILLR
jgi:hypothetical protein